ncbi:MAG: sulfurtransferase TusE, partial [Verrucomicrobia bacterium]|nr:sulfurtransferase TusE [Verrucomicrobiota bacterium]
MATIELSGKQFEVDEDGFIQDTNLWTEDVARAFA